MQFKYIIIFIIIFQSSILTAYTFKSAVSLNLSIMPNMGNNLSSDFQKNDLNVNNGIFEINRSKTGISTTTIKPLSGYFIEAQIHGLTLDYLILSIGANYGQNLFSGSGKSLDDSDNIMDVKYSMWLVGIPLTIGLSIPFWEDTKVIFTTGISFSYGTYSNSFSSATVNQKASFTGLGIPMVTKIAGEHFISKDIAISSSLSYYNGATTVIKNQGDYAIIDYSGYRFSFGISYYFKEIRSYN